MQKLKIEIIRLLGTVEGGVYTLQRRHSLTPLKLEKRRFGLSIFLYIYIYLYLYLINLIYTHTHNYKNNTPYNTIHGAQRNKHYAVCCV